MSTPQIALVTYAKNPALVEGDDLLPALLASKGYDAVAVAWDDASVDWSRFAAIILRSTWDYHHRQAEFAAWLQQLQAQNAPLFNSAATVLWNMDKHYLGALAQAGVKIPPTVWLEQGATDDLAQVLAAQGWTDAVIKPAISASATDTWRVTAADAGASQARLEALTQQRSMLIQAFLPEITTEGEWSLMFFSGVYSHAILKTPAKGDMRVQKEYGGSSVLETAPQALVEQAADILTVAQQITGALPLYARVDGVAIQETFVLMELELIEPYLFLEYADGAAHFAAAIAQQADGAR